MTFLRVGVCVRIGGLALALAVVPPILATGCSLSAPSVGQASVVAKPADQLFREARANLASARFLTEKDRYNRKSGHESITNTTDLHGGAVATWHLGGGIDNLVQVGGRQWQRPDLPYLTAVGRTDTYAKRVLPGHWELLRNAAPLTRGTIFLAGGDLFNYLNGERTDYHKGAMQQTDGVSTIVLSDVFSDLYVSTTNPARFVKAVWKISPVSGVSNWVTDFTYPSHVAGIVAPTEFYDPDDVSTFPARHRVIREDSTSCDQSSCSFVAAVTNDYGKEVGQSTLTFHVTDPGGTEFTSCSTPIPVIPHGGSQDLKCSVSGPAWTAHSGLTIQYQATVHDPLWDA